MASFPSDAQIKPVTLRVVALVAILMIAAACGADADHMDAPEGERWELVEHAHPSPSTNPFGAELVVAATADGTLYGGDRQNHRIVQFDVDGNEITASGRRGGGPAEFEDLIGLQLDSAGRLWSVDPGNGRFTIFSTDLEPLETQPYVGFRAVPWTGRIDRDGVAHNPQVAFSPEGAQQLYVRSAPVDSLPIPPYTVRQQEVRAPTGETRLVNVPYGRRPHWVMDHTGALWFGDGGEPMLHRLSYAGDTAATISLPDRGVALTAEQRAEVVDALLGDFHSATVIDSAWIPAARPTIEGLTVDDQNRLWVTIPLGSGGVEYHVYGEDGRQIAVASLPQGAGLPRRISIGGDYLHAVVHDALGVPTIVTYRIAS